MLSIRGTNIYLMNQDESDEDELTIMQKRVAKTKNNAQKRWQREYISSLIESHRINRKQAKAPEVGEMYSLSCGRGREGITTC